MKGRIYAVGPKKLPIGIKTALKETFDVTMNQIWELNRDANLCGIRAILMVYLRLSDFSLTYYQIGTMVHRSHCNVMHFCKGHKDRMEVDRDYRASYNAFERAMI